MIDACETAPEAKKIFAYNKDGSPKYPSDFSYDADDETWYSIFGHSGNLKQAITDSMEILSLKQLALEKLQEAVKNTSKPGAWELYSVYEDKIKSATSADNEKPVPTAQDLETVEDLAQWKDDPTSWPAYEKENVMIYLGSLKNEIKREMPAGDAGGRESAAPASVEVPVIEGDVQENGNELQGDVMNAPEIVDDGIVEG